MTARRTFGARQSRVRRCAIVITKERTGHVVVVATRMASAQARISRVRAHARRTPSTRSGSSRCSRSWWAVRSARIASRRCLDQILDVHLDRVTDGAHLLERPPAGSGMSQSSTIGRHIRALGAAGERDRPVGVQLHLHGQLLRPPPGRCRCRSHASPRRPRARLARPAPGRPTRRGCRAARGVEERLRHLRAPGVVGADEQDVLHSVPSTFAAVDGLRLEAVTVDRSACGCSAIPGDASSSRVRMTPDVDVYGRGSRACASRGPRRARRSRSRHHYVTRA